MSVIRDVVRRFASVLSLTTGSISRSGVEDVSAIDCSFSDGGDVELEDERA